MPLIGSKDSRPTEDIRVDHGNGLIETYTIVTEISGSEHDGIKQEGVIIRQKASEIENSDPNRVVTTHINTKVYNRELLYTFVIRWDLKDENGRPIKLTKTNIQELDSRSQNAIIKRCRKILKMNGGELEDGNLPPSSSES